MKLQTSTGDGWISEPSTDMNHCSITRLWRCSMSWRASRYNMHCGLPPFFHHEMPAARKIARGLGNAIFKLSKYPDLRVYTTGIYKYIYVLYSIRNFTTDIDTNKVKGHKWHVLHPPARTNACMGRLIRRSEKERSQNHHLMVARIPLRATTKCYSCYTP